MSGSFKCKKEDCNYIVSLKDFKSRVKLGIPSELIAKNVTLICVNNFQLEPEDEEIDMEGIN